MISLFLLPCLIFFFFSRLHYPHSTTSQSLSPSQPNFQDRALRMPCHSPSPRVFKITGFPFVADSCQHTSPPTPNPHRVFLPLAKPPAIPRPDFISKWIQPSMMIPSLKVPTRYQGTYKADGVELIKSLQKDAIRPTLCRTLGSPWPPPTPLR